MSGRAGQLGAPQLIWLYQWRESATEPLKQDRVISRKTPRVMRTVQTTGSPQVNRSGISSYSRTHHFSTHKAVYTHFLNCFELLL